jgi:hypothetical protein
MQFTITVIELPSSFQAFFRDPTVGAAKATIGH